MLGGSQTGTLETGTLSLERRKTHIYQRIDMVPVFVRRVQPFSSLSLPAFSSLSLPSGGVLGTFHGISKYPFAKYLFASCYEGDMAETLSEGGMR